MNAFKQLVAIVDSPAGHILCVLLVFFIGALLSLAHMDYGKEIMAGALGSLWTLLQVRKGEPA